MPGMGGQYHRYIHMSSFSFFILLALPQKDGKRENRIFQLFLEKRKDSVWESETVTDKPFLGFFFIALKMALEEQV